jgi:hypothetical protein
MQISSASHGLSSLFSASYNHGQNGQNSQAGDTGSSQRQRSGSAINPVQATAKSEQDLSQSEEQEVRKLKTRDREVRAHEQAHKSTAGGLARGGASYEYTTGPDGKQYAVGGEVKINTAPVKGNPEATIRKAQQIQRAATAPSEPSAQDMQVAAQAISMQMEARSEKRQMETEEAAEGDSSNPLASAANPVSTKPTSQTDSEEDNTVARSEKEEGIKCAICGGEHSGESHNETNIQKINQVFQLSGAASSGVSLVV